jgi:TetR/AcrR family transcriptional regulator, ethionamide resistance regulator
MSMSMRTRRRPSLPHFWAISNLAAGGRAALLALAALYARHGRLLRALAEASSQDREAKRAWKEFLEPVIKGHAEKIREEIAQGRIAGVDPEPTARALIGMNLQYFFDQLVDNPRPDLEATADTLLKIWLRALYGTHHHDFEPLRSNRR